MIEFFSIHFFITLILFSLWGTAAGGLCLIILIIRDFIKKQTW